MGLSIIDDSVGSHAGVVSLTEVRVEGGGCAEVEADGGCDKFNKIGISSGDCSCVIP